MKLLNRVVSLLMIILMLVTSVPCVSISAVSDDNKTYTLTVEDDYASSFSATDSAEGAFSFFGSTGFSGRYGYQLSDLAREIYGSLVNYYGDNKNTGEYTHGFLTPFTFDAEIDGGSIVMNGELEAIAYEIRCAVQIATDAFRYDHPEVFWMYSIGSSYSISASGNDVDGYVGEISSINIIPEEIYEGASAKISQYETAVGGIHNLITDAEGRYDILKVVHDYICQFAYYNLIDEKRVHSSEPFFVGDNGMVCEGYAKTFKVLCDELDIPCVLVSGNASGAHMWNYVQMEDGKWYVVDATWDDRDSRIFDTYFLANANTVGFAGVTISEERTERTDFSGTGIFSFTYPVLSQTEYVLHVHEWESEYTVDEEATCLITGWESIHCKSCDKTKDGKEIPVIPHTESAPVEENRIEATCDTDGSYDTVVYCSVCGDELSRKTTTLKATGHTCKTSTTKATLKKNGKQVTRCTVCGDIKSSKTIYYPKTVRLSTSTYTYNGEKRTPKVIVKDSKGNTLKKDTDYTVKYSSGRKNPGKYTVTVIFKGKYEGTKKLTLTIKPKAPAINDIYSKTKGKAVVKWSDVSGESGYQVYYSTKKDSGFKKLDSYKANVVKGSKSKLTSGKKYYFKVRAYTKTDSGTVYSSWSQVRSVKVK